MVEMPAEAVYVWTGVPHGGRNPYAAFRRTFEIEGIPEGAVDLNIFADTHYQLFVNGEFTGFGPIRFDPRFPEYDTHDIGPHLRQGKNTIAVLVNSIQHVVFRTVPAGAGMIAWGKVPDSKGTGEIDLATGSGGWKARPATEYLNAPRMSFALQAGELYDQALACEGWTLPDFNDSSWAPALEVGDQTVWGPLSPRSIPHMEGKPLSAEGITVYPLLPVERVYSHSLDTPHLDSLPPASSQGPSGSVVCETWIWSPEDQTVSAGVHWNEHWINGEKANGPRDIDGPSYRQQQLWSLKAGWNHYIGVKGTQGPVLQHYFSLPEGMGLVVSADKTPVQESGRDSGPILRRTGLSREMVVFIADNPLPWKPGTEVPGGWEPVCGENAAQNPCLEYAWDSYATPPETLDAKALQGHTFKKSLYPHGFCALIDLGRMHLMHPTLTVHGAQGSKADMVYGEQFQSDGRHIRILPWVPLGDRALVSGEDFSWTTCHVRGTRWLAVTVRNTPGDVRLSMDFRSANYPVARIGEFRCSDPALTDIWGICRNTQESNMEDAYVDCSGRERGLYIRDTIIQYHNNLALFGDQALFRRCMDLIGQSPDATRKFRAVYPNTGTYTIADFSLNAVEGFMAYYLNSGDISVTEKHWPAIMADLDWFHELSDERGDGLLNGTWDKARGVREMYGGFHGDNSLTPDMMDKEGPHCAFTCTYLMALRAAAGLAGAMGKTGDQAALEARIAKLERTIPEAFWDASKGCFSDTLSRTTWSLQSNLMAVNAGVTDTVMMNSIKSYAKGTLKSIFRNGYDPSGGVWFSPHYSFYMFDGLYRLGLADVAQETIRQGWGWMLSKDLNTCPEFFTLRDSLCHAWSASPAYYLSRNILGVRLPESPDSDEVEIRVDAPGIDWAEGTFPHPKGAVRVKWHMESGRRIFDNIEVPEGCMVSIPR